MGHPLFYGFLAALLGLVIGLADIPLTKIFKLSKNISKWITLVSLALIIFLGWFNGITLVFKSVQWALAFLAFGLTYQTTIYLNERERDALRFLSSQILLLVSLVVLVAVGIHVYRFLWRAC